VEYRDDSLLLNATGEVFIYTKPEPGTKLAELEASIEVESKGFSGQPLTATASMALYYPDHNGDMEFHAQADIKDWQMNDNIAVEEATMSLSGLVNTANGGFEFEANVSGRIKIIKGEEHKEDSTVKADDFLSQMSNFAATVSFDIEATVSKTRCVEGATGQQCGLTLDSASIHAEYYVMIPGDAEDQPKFEVTGTAGLVYPCLKGDKVGRRRWTRVE
jgi:hypothetical protein